MDWTQFLTPLVMVVFPPLFIWLLKKKVPDKFSYLYPLLAGVLGPVIDQVTQVAGAQPQGWKAVAYGLAGVGLREIVDQLKKVRS